MPGSRISEDTALDSASKENEAQQKQWDAIQQVEKKSPQPQHDAQADARFKEIREAYEVLSDPEKRRRYEQFGQYWNQAGGMGGGAAPGMDVDFGRYGNFDDFINDLLGRFGGPGGGGFQGGGFPGGGFPGGGFAGGGFPRGAQASRAPVNLDAEASVNVTFAEAFRGGERSLSVNNERVQVRIPAGVKNGSRLRLKGKGNLQPGTGRAAISISISRFRITRSGGWSRISCGPISPSALMNWRLEDWSRL